MSKMKFVLLSAARCGTSLTMQTLGAHPDIWVAGEIFHPTPEGLLPPELCAPERLARRELDPTAFVEEVLEFDGEKKVSGFKM